MCIRFGMVSMDTDVEELLALVTRTGMDLDEQVNKLQVCLFTFCEDQLFVYILYAEHVRVGA